jgi:hypothetical protein
MLAPPPYENELFDSADALQNACVDFAKSKGYVVNQRDLDKKRGRLRLKCAHKTTTKQGGGNVGLHLFIYLFSSRDSAIDPKGICGLGKTNEMSL